jgi:hypothetical protein
VAGTVVIASAVIAFLAVTAATRFRFRFRTTSLIMFPVARMVPVEALTIVRDLDAEGLRERRPGSPRRGRPSRRGEPRAIPVADPFPARPARSDGRRRVFLHLRLERLPYSCNDDSSPASAER